MTGIVLLYVVIYVNTCIRQTDEKVPHLTGPAKGINKDKRIIRLC